MKTYITDFLNNGFIRPSKSLAVARVMFIKRLDGKLRIGIRLSGCNLNRLISSVVRNVHGCMCIDVFILVIDTCRCDCIGTIMCWDSVVDTRRICCEHVVHDVDTLSTGCQAVSVLYRIPHAFVI